VKDIVKETLESVKGHMGGVDGKVRKDVKKYLDDHAAVAMRLIAQIADQENKQTGV